MAIKGLPKLPIPPTGIDYSEHLVSKPVTSEITVSKSTKGVVTDEKVKPTTVEHPGATTPYGTGMIITVEGGKTVNLGNFNSAKIGVSISVPCNMASLEDAWDFGSNWVSKKIDEAVAEAQGA